MRHDYGATQAKRIECGKCSKLMLGVGEADPTDRKIGDLPGTMFFDFCKCSETKLELKQERDFFLTGFTGLHFDSLPIAERTYAVDQANAILFAELEKAKTVYGTEEVCWDEAQQVEGDLPDYVQAKVVARKEIEKE